MSNRYKIAINRIYLQKKATGLGIVNHNLIAQLMSDGQYFDFS